MPMIAMTREMGSLGKDVAAGIAARMDRKVVYHEIIEPIANKMRLRKSHVERFLEGKSGIWERLTTDKTSLSIFTAQETFRFLKDGSTGVIRGWGAVHLLKNVPHVVRVRICAPLAMRIDRMMERLATDNREAVANEIALSEETVDECVDAVAALIARPRFQETAESLRLVEDLATEWAVRAALRRDERTREAAIHVDCDGGVARLTGAVDNLIESNAAEDVAAAVEGVQRVDNQLRAANAAFRYRREG
jgi:hypothetical protein